MIEFDEEQTITITYEMTKAIAQFENLKPKIRMTCALKDAKVGLETCRKLLKEEYKRIKSND